jgi:hypothetical protein
VLDSESEEAAEIQGAGVFPVQPVRKAAGLPPQIRHVPYLFP